MRETLRSLRAYFLVVGVLATLGALQTVTAAGATPLVRVLGGLHLLIAVGYLWFGVRLAKYLAGSPGRVLQFLLVSCGFSLLGRGADIAIVAGAVGAGNVPPLLYAYPVITILITVYLYANVKRLAKEASGTPPADVVKTFE